MNCPTCNSTTSLPKGKTQVKCAQCLTVYDVDREPVDIPLAPMPKQEDPMPKITAPELLEAGAATYRERNKSYGDSYHKFGRVMDALFPEGITCESAEEWNQLGVLTQIVSKLTRLSNDFDRLHKDSVHDIMVYAAMLEELIIQEPGNDFI